MRKINKVKNLAGLLDLASVPQYQNGGETTLEVTLPEVEVYGDQLRRDMQRTGLTYDELTNLNYGAQRQSQIQRREEGVKELAYNAPVTGDVLSLYDIGRDIYEGNYGKAALGAGLFFVPNILERPLKRLYRKGKNIIKYFNAKQRYQRAIDAADNLSKYTADKSNEYWNKRYSIQSDKDDLNYHYVYNGLNDLQRKDEDFAGVFNLDDLDIIYPVTIKKKRSQGYPNVDQMPDQNFKDFVTKDLDKNTSDVLRLLEENSGIDQQGYRYYQTENYQNEYVKNVIKSLNTKEQIPIFRTGEVIEPTISIDTPKRISRRRLSTGETISYGDINSENATKIAVPESYESTIRDNIQYVKEMFPGFSPFGSSVGAAYSRFPHVSADIDGYITDVDFENQVRKKVKSKNISDIRSGNTYRVDLFDGKFGHSGEIDFNIIKTDPNTGMAVGENAEELYRQFFPEEYNLAFKRQFDGKPFTINKTPQELIRAANPSTKTILDSFEIDFTQPTKNKHAGRSMAYLSYADPNSVSDGIHAFGKSLVGNKVKLAPTFPLEQLSDVEQNLRILERLQLPIDNVAVARDPRKMQNALDFWYLNRTIRSRGTNAKNAITGIENSLELERGFRNWNYTGTGGTAMGGGLNTVVLGDSHVHTDAYGNIQANPRQKLRSDSPETFIDSVERFVGSPNYKFTDQEKQMINAILQKHGISISQNWSTPEDLLLSADMPRSGKNLWDALNEISSTLDIPYITRSDTYGNSYYSSVIRDVDRNDAVNYGPGRNKPTSLLSRKEILKERSTDGDLDEVLFALGKAYGRGITDILKTDSKQFDEYLKRIRRISKLRLNKKKSSQDDNSLYDAYLKNKQLNDQLESNKNKAERYANVTSSIREKKYRLQNRLSDVENNISNAKMIGIGAGIGTGIGLSVYGLNRSFNDDQEYSEGGIHKYQNGGYTQEYYDERRRKARWDTSVEQLKNLLSGLNKTFGTAAAGASLLTGGGWALNRLLRRNHPSTLGQKLAPMVLPANAADTAGDVSKMVENPSFENTLDLSSGLILGRFKNLGNPIRQLAELISQGFNVDDIIPNHSKGGIHIKKKNRGKFTETMKRTGKTAEELKHSKNPLTRKRAVFAINSRRWAKKK